MGQKLFVGGLSWDTNTDGLRAAFERFGDIEDAIAITTAIRRSRGFGLTLWITLRPRPQLKR